MVVRIRQIRAIGLGGATPEGGWSVELRPEDSVHTLVFVDTEEGVTGVGSTFTNVGLVQAALRVLEPLFLGESAIEPDRVTEKLHQHTFWMGRGGSITHTISGINTALWDIAGKVYGQPVGRLLGGRYRDRVTPYVSILMDEPQAIKERMAELAAQNYRAFKIGWGEFGRRSPAYDEAIVVAARDAVGEEIALMVDAGASDAFWPNDLKWALRTADMLASYGVAWFEEPLPPDALHDFMELRRQSRVPIAGGETLTRRQAFMPWLQNYAFDIVQPDITKVGGLSEARRIGWRADDLGIQLIPHGWNTAIGLAADMQLASALPRTTLIEYIHGSPYVDDLTVSGWRVDDHGDLCIPDAPGLGVEVDMAALERFAVR